LGGYGYGLRPVMRRKDNGSDDKREPRVKIFYAVGGESVLFRHGSGGEMEP
jgi:hypothetical protein